MRERQTKETLLRTERKRKREREKESKNKRKTKNKNKPEIKRQTPLVQSFFCVTQYNEAALYTHAYGHTHNTFNPNENGIPHFTTK